MFHVKQFVPGTRSNGTKNVSRETFSASPVADGFFSADCSQSPPMTLIPANSKPGDRFDDALTVREALRDGIRALEEAETPSAPLAAELLLMHVRGKDRAWLYAHPEEVLSRADREKYLALVQARAAGTPTQYLTGKQEFWGLEFEVTRDVLIPRPETEHVIEVALARIGDARRNAKLQIADIGTGSGCISVALAHELPHAEIFATDISRAALEVARRNAARHGVAERIHFIESDLLSNVSEPAQFDVIVSNPPYVAERDAATLPRDVREHEPRVALFAGETGMDVYVPLIAQAEARLKNGGTLVLEIGFGMFEAVSDLLDTSRGWTRIRATMDLAEIPRVLSATKF
jgi:release factor glutamine methyltransferase